MENTLFHLSLPCVKLLETKIFYVDIIGASLGRYSQNWFDVNLFGHQVTFTKSEKSKMFNTNYKFEGEILPSFHFGIIVDIDTWSKIYAKLLSENIDVTTKTTFLKNKVGEHLSFFVKDPNEYQLEFKCFKKEEDVFTS